MGGGGAARLDLDPAKAGGGGWVGGQVCHWWPTKDMFARVGTTPHTYHV